MPHLRYAVLASAALLATLGVSGCSVVDHTSTAPTVEPVPTGSTAPALDVQLLAGSVEIALGDAQRIRKVILLQRSEPQVRLEVGYARPQLTVLAPRVKLHEASPDL